MEVESDYHFRAKELEMERMTLHHMYQQARTHEMIMQRLLPEVPRFKTYPIFSGKSEKSQSMVKPEQVQSHQLEQSHEAKLSQQPQEVEISDSAESVHTDTRHLDGSERLNEERNKLSSTTPFSKTSSTQKVPTEHAACKPVLVPLTMDTAMTSFPVRVSSNGAYTYMQ